MRNSNLNSTITKLQQLNRELDDLKDILKFNGMTHHIEQAYIRLAVVQADLSCTVAILNQYKKSTQPETKEYSIEKGNLASKLNSIYGC